MLTGALTDNLLPAARTEPDPRHVALTRAAMPSDGPRQDALQKTAEEFEGLFARLLVQKALESSDEEHGGLLGKGPGREVLKGLVEDTLVSEISRASVLGIAERIEEEFMRHPSIQGEPQ